MLKIYFLFCLLFINYFSQAQILDPTIINTAGGKINIYSKTNQVKINWTLDWSLGESLATQTWQLKNKLIYSTGFLQPALMLNPAFTHPANFDFNIIWGPNPVSTNVWLSCKQAGIDIMSIHIMDNYGNKIQNIKGPFSGLHFSKQIPFASVNTGIYFIALHYIVANKFSQMKIIKIIKI
jgi:hypothetical protein